MVPSTQDDDECWWTTPDDLKGARVIRDWADVDEWTRAYEDEEPVPELEVEAHFDPIFGTTEVLVDGIVYLVGVELRGDGDVREASLSLAQLVVDRV